MLAVLGLIILAASIGTLWQVLPTDGKVHRLATMPFVETLLPIGIVTGIAMGSAFVLTIFIR